jgi:hypothetical protein
MLRVKDSRSESDSGTVSRAGSFLWEQLQWPPWLQQHVSAKVLENANCVERLEVCNTSRNQRKLTSVTLNGWLQVGTFTCLLAAVALDVSRARLAHGATVSALGNRSTLLVDMLKWAVYRRIVVSNREQS